MVKIISLSQEKDTNVVSGTVQIPLPKFQHTGYGLVPQGRINRNEDKQSYS
jgi:hypothetical protein